MHSSAPPLAEPSLFTSYRADGRSLLRACSSLGTMQAICSGGPSLDVSHRHRARHQRKGLHIDPELPRTFLGTGDTLSTHIITVATWA